MRGLSDAEIVSPFLDLGRIDQRATIDYCIRYSGRSTYQGSASVPPWPGESEWNKAINSSGSGTRYAVLSSLPLLRTVLSYQYGVHKHTGTAGQASPQRGVLQKISGRLKSNFFSLVPARRLPRPTILDPGPYQPSLARVPASLPIYRFGPVDIIIG